MWRDKKIVDEYLLELIKMKNFKIGLAIYIKLHVHVFLNISTINMIKHNIGYFETMSHYTGKIYLEHPIC